MNRTTLYADKILAAVLSEMIGELCQIYGDSLSEIVLYGSYARGTQNDESDVDIALFLSDQPSKEITNAMIDCVAAKELKCDKVLSVIDINFDKYKLWKDTLPFYQNIEKEGITLWKAAA